MNSTWLVNTSLTKLDPDECKDKQQGKMSKTLFAAYQIAAEGHDLDYFKQILKDFQEEQRAFEEEQAKKDAEKAEADAKKAEKAAETKETAGVEKEKKKKARKSKGGDDEDVAMEDAEETKPSKKRKKETTESDGDGAKVRAFLSSSLVMHSRILPSGVPCLAGFYHIIRLAFEKPATRMEKQGQHHRKREAHARTQAVAT